MLLHTIAPFIIGIVLGIAIGFCAAEEYYAENDDSSDYVDLYNTKTIKI